MRINKRIVFSVMAATAALAIPSGVASGASSSLRVYPVWCGHWDPNPINARPLGEQKMVFPDGAVGQIIWGAYNHAVYVWARMTHAPVDERIAIAWLDYQNHATYQCGDSHGYPTATMWPGVSATWTAGVPLTPPSRGDSQADCVWFLVWRPSGSVDYRSPKCIAPWITNHAPPAPEPGAGPTPAPGAGPNPAPRPEPGGRPVRIRARISVWASHRAIGARHVLRLRGQVDGLPASVGVRIELQARLNGPRQWRTLGLALTTADGRFSYARRVTWPTGARVYTLRARLPRQRGYQAAVSRQIRVRVTG